MSKQKIMADLMAIESVGATEDITLSAFLDGFNIEASLYGEEMFLFPIEGHVSFENLYKEFPDLKIVHMFPAHMDSSSIVFIQLEPNVRMSCIIHVNVVKHENTQRNAFTAIKNNLLFKELDDFVATSIVIAHKHTELDKAKANIATISNDVQKHRIPGKSGKNFKLGLITYVENRLNVVVRRITFNSEYEDLDTLYEGVDQKFHDELLKQIKTTTKGNIVFNGKPGTGKSYYIRKLIKDYFLNQKNKSLADEDLDDMNLVSINKYFEDDKLFIYIPSNLAHLFSDPGFTSLLQEKALEYNNGIVIILEDAEKIIESRDKEGSSAGVSALLNMSDGIMNDLVSTQFIFTYNTDSENIDSAILRPGRLLAKKEFRELPPEKANKLAEKIGVKKKYTKSVSVATVFSELNGAVNEILIEEEKKKTAISF